MMHVSSHPNIVRLHAGVQGLAYVVFAVAGGLGIWMAREVHAVRINHLCTREPLQECVYKRDRTFALTIECLSSSTTTTRS